MKIIREFDEFNLDDFDNGNLKDITGGLEELGFEKFKGVLIMTINRNGKTEAELISGRNQKEINEGFKVVHELDADSKTIIGIGSYLSEMQKAGKIIFWDILDGIEMRPEFKTPIYKPFDYSSPYYFVEVLDYYTINGKGIINNVYEANNRQTKQHYTIKDGDLRLS